MPCFLLANHYEIVSESYLTFPEEVVCLLISNGSKYNAYIIFDSELKYPIDPEYIVKSYGPESLSTAISCFPYFNLNEKNYGFESSGSDPLCDRVLYSG